MNNGNGLQGGVPILGAPTAGKVGVQVGAIPRRLDGNGQMDVAVVNSPQGPRPLMVREAYVDAEGLVEMIEEVLIHQLQPIREELRVLRNKLGKVDVE